jgi:predicted DNA binding CopG/RHH family protein
MTNKILTSIRLTERQLALLREEAAALGIALPELIRRILDRHLEGGDHK